MNKKEFINELSGLLSGLPEEDINRSTQFYSELIEDGKEDGKTEEEAVAELGDINDIAAQIKANPEAAAPNDTIPQNAPAAAAPAKKKMSAAEIVLIIVTFPIWIGPAASLFGIYVSIWAVIVSLYITGGALVLSGVAGIVASCFQAGAAQILFSLGCSLVILGMGPLIIILMNLLTRLYARFTVWLVGKIKSLFV